MGKDYGKSPIAEAAFQIGFAAPIPTDFRDFADSVYPLLSAHYDGDVHPLFSLVDGGIKTGELKVEVDGYRLSDARGQRILQLKTKFMAISILAPYPGGEAFRAACEQSVRLSGAIFPEALVNKVSMRFIDRWDLPDGKSPESHIARLQRFDDPDAGKVLKELRHEERIVQGTDTRQVKLLFDQSAHRITLDLDLLTDCSLESGDVATLMSEFDRLKAAHVAFFEAAITDEAKELFK